MDGVGFLKESELKEVIEIYDSAFSKFISQETDIVKAKGLFNKLIDRKDYFFIVYRLKNKVVGFIAAHLIEDFFAKSNPILTLNSVCVHSNYRRKHIATKMLKFSEDIAKSFNCECILFTSERTLKGAHDLYRKLGYDLESEKGCLKEL